MLRPRPFRTMRTRTITGTGIEHRSRRYTVAPPPPARNRGTAGRGRNRHDRLRNRRPLPCRTHRRKVRFMRPLPMPPRRALPLSPTRPKCPVERNESPTDSAVPGRPTTYRQPFDNRSTTAPGEKNNLFTDYRRVFNRYPQNYRQPADENRTQTTDRARASIAHGRFRNEDSGTVRTINSDRKRQRENGTTTLRKKNRLRPRRAIRQRSEMRTTQKT